MKHKIELENLFSTMSNARADYLTLFAFINLGLIESLANGSIGASEAIDKFYFADNCLFVRKIMKNKTADQIMSHGVQLPDLFDCVSAEQVQREFLHELSVMRKLSLQLLDNKRRVA